MEEVRAYNESVEYIATTIGEDLIGSSDGFDNISSYEATKSILDFTRV